MMQIGNVQIENNVFSAPMAGVSDRAFRILAREVGCGLVYTEMISSQALLYSNPKTFHMADFSQEKRPLAVQIFGSKPEHLAGAAEIVAARGATIIDINMGCPAPKIVKNNEGSALMTNPLLAAQIVQAVVHAVSVPVTVKMRKGWDEDSINAVEFAQIVTEAGAAAVTVHGRTRTQFYSGEADWETIRQVKQAVKVPVIGNGDIWQPEDAQKMLEQTGCDGVMIGRGAMGNPWLFQQTLYYLKTGQNLSEPTLTEKIKTAIRHLQMIVQDKGETIGVAEMRKHAAWYTKGFPGAARLRDKINQSKTEAELIEVLENICF